MGRFPVSRHPLVYALVMLMAWPWGPMLLAWEASMEPAAEQGTLARSLAGRRFRNITRLERLGPSADLVISRADDDEEERDDDGPGLVASDLGLSGSLPLGFVLAFHRARPPRIVDVPPLVTHLCRLRC